jgi:hypothetical protein
MYVDDRDSPEFQLGHLLVMFSLLGFSLVCWVGVAWFLSSLTVHDWAAFPP